MVLDKSSIKELYDNRDIIAQLGCLRNDMDKLPHGHQLQLLWEYMVLFINRYEYLMLEDKSAYIDARHTYVVAPEYDSEKGPKELSDLRENEFVSRRMISGGGIDDKNFVKKNDPDLQKIVGGLEAQSFISDIGDLGIINTNKVRVNRTKGNKNDGEIFSVLGESLFDGNINCFGDFNGGLIDVRYGEFAERPSLKSGSEQPVISNSFITLGDFIDNHYKFDKRPVLESEGEQPLTGNNFITLDDVNSLYLKLNSSNDQIVTGPVTMNGSLNLNNSFGVVIRDEDYSICGDLVFNKDKLQINQQMVTINSTNGTTITGPVTMNGSLNLNNSFGVVIRDEDYSICGDLVFNREKLNIVHQKIILNGILGTEFSGQVNFLAGNCKTVIGNDGNTTYIGFVNQGGLYSPRINFGEKSLYIQLAEVGTGNQSQISSYPAYTSIVNKDSSNKRGQLFVFKDQCIMEVFGSASQATSRIECWNQECFMTARFETGAGLRLFVTPVGTGYYAVDSSTTDNFTYTEDDFFTTRRDIKDMVKTTKTVGDNYEQIELPFNLFNRPISLIIRRTKEGNMFRDQLLTKTDNNIKIISDQYTAM